PITITTIPPFYLQDFPCLSCAPTTTTAVTIATSASASMAQLPCDGDGVCMLCKTKPISELETLICKTCITPWHASCLTTPLEWDCPDCSMSPVDDSVIMVSAVNTSSSSNELVSMIREIEGDTTLTDQEKAKKRQQLLSGSLKSPDLDDDEKKSGGNDMMKILDDKLNCSFCMQLPDRPTPCGHNFCLKCFEKWVKVKAKNPGIPKCPQCFTVVPKSMLINPRINSALAVVIRMSKVERHRGSVTGPVKVYHVVQNQSRPDEAFTTERAKKLGRLMLAAGRSLSLSQLITLGPYLSRMILEGIRECWLGSHGGIGWNADNGERTFLMLRELLGSLTMVHSLWLFQEVTKMTRTMENDSSIQEGGRPFFFDQKFNEILCLANSGGRDLSGNKRTNKEQSFDQKFEKYNEALRVSCRKGYPLRVVRSHKEKRSSYAPETGIRYDGGQKVCRYLFVRCDNEPAPWTSDEHGDRPRPLPVIKELSGATDVTDRKDSPSWDYDEEDSCWKWKKPPPPSNKHVQTGNPGDAEDFKKERKAWKKAQNKSLTNMYLKGFKCQISLEVMTLPLTTPCAHNFCKPCLENVFAGKTFVRERSSHGRTLRAKKVNNEVPVVHDRLICVNRELMGVIEDLQRKAKEEKHVDPCEELDESENMTVAAEEGSDNSDLMEGNPETEGEPKQMNKRLKTVASDSSENVEGSKFKSDDSAVEEMELDVTDGHDVLENSAAATKVKKIRTKRITKKKTEGEHKQMNKHLKTQASRNVDGSEFKSGESAVEETKHDVADGNNVVENSAAEETIEAETKLKQVPVDVVIGRGDDSPSSPLQIGSHDNTE
ncbi:hypothetical protein C5167_041012, partial [Papaver somniferum]